GRPDVVVGDCANPVDAIIADSCAGFVWHIWLPIQSAICFDLCKGLIDPVMPPVFPLGLGRIFVCAAGPAPLNKRRLGPLELRRIAGPSDPETVIPRHQCNPMLE